MKRTLRFIAGLSLIISATGTNAHETSVHEILTKAAAKRSVLMTQPGFLESMGFAEADKAVYYRAMPALKPVDLPEAMAYGAYWEDDYYSWRAFNHFFDPQANNLIGRGLDVGPVLGNDSPSWILEDRNNMIDRYDGTCPQKRSPGCPQEFSFRKGQQELYKALTSATTAERHAARFKVLQNLGHVVHHIQDMAQPQHTRNDQHTHPIPFLAFNPDWAFYEVYTEEKRYEITGILDANPYPIIPKFATAREFWQTPGGAAPQYRGMAEFTSNNYTSYGTQYVGRAYDKNFIGAAYNFPYPNGSNRRMERIVEQPVLYPDGRWRSGATDYVVGVVTDTLAPSQSKERLLATKSILSPLAPKLPPIFIENARIHDDNYSILLPRAVAFSAGIINHFFRGRLAISKGEAANTFVIKNAGEAAMSGSIMVLAEDENGTRSAIPGASTTVSTLAPNSPVTLTFSPPDNTKSLVAVFRGKIGSEGEASGSEWAAVAGVSVPYTPPEIVIVGHSWSTTFPAFTRAFRWSSRDGLSYFPVPGGAAGTEAWGVSPDGKFVVGSTMGSITTLGVDINDYSYIINNQIPPSHTVSAPLTVAVGWAFRTSWPGSSLVFLNGNAKVYSKAWRTTNEGRVIYGETEIPGKGGNWPATWNSFRLAQPSGKISDFNSLTSADGSITLITKEKRAAYVRGGKTVILPRNSGHDASLATHVVIVP